MQSDEIQMIYTASLGLTPEQTAPQQSSTLRSPARRCSAFVRRFIDAIREGVTKSRAALAEHNGFDAQ